MKKIKESPSAHIHLSQDVVDRLSIMISRLGYFTASELAKYADTSEANAILFVSNHPSLYISGNMGGSEHSEITWKIRAEEGYNLAKRAADLSRKLYAQPTERGLHMSINISPLELLEEGLEFLEEGLFDNDEERNSELALAKLNLLASEASIHDREELSLPVDEAEKVRIENSRVRLIAFSQSSIECPVIITQTEKEQKIVLSILMDWTAGLPDYNPCFGDDFFESNKSREVLDKLLSLNDSHQHPISLDFLKAIIAHRPVLVRNNKLAGSIQERLDNINSKYQARLIPVLSVLSSILDYGSSVESIFRLVLSNTFMKKLSMTEYNICLMSLARFARPRSNNVAGVAKAAAACHYLLCNNTQRDNLPLIAPAALCSSTSNNHEILKYIVEMFDKSGLKKEYSEHIEEGAFLRNLATVLNLDSFISFDNYLKHMPMTHDAEGFIRAITDPRYGALELKDYKRIDDRIDNSIDFAIGLGDVVSSYLGFRDRLTVPLNIECTSKTGKILNDMLTQRRWKTKTEYNHNVKTEIPSSKSIPNRVRSFIEQLSENHRQRRLLEGVGA